MESPEDGTGHEVPATSGVLTWSNGRLSWEAEITIIQDDEPQPAFVVNWTPSAVRKLLDQHPDDYRVRMRRVSPWEDVTGGGEG